MSSTVSVSRFAPQRERKASALRLGIGCVNEGPQSVARLPERAVAAGYDDFEHMQQDSDPTPLRELPEFEALFSPKQEKKPAPDVWPKP